MLYLSELLHKPIIDKSGTTIGEINDLVVNTKDVFPRVVALTYKASKDGSDTQRMIDWSEYVAGFTLDGDSDEESSPFSADSVKQKGESSARDISSIRLNADLNDLEFTHLKDDEIQLGRDLLHKQIVDVKEKRVARVSDLKLSSSGLDGSNELRLLGAECGLQGRLRSMSGFKAKCALAGAALTGKKVEEKLIAWNYIDIPGRDMSNLELSVSHQRLNQLRPADIADIIEQLDPKARATVFAHLDKKDAAETISELEEIYRADVIEGLPEDHAVNLLATMQPDDATDILSGLDYEKAEKILHLMGIEDANTIRTLMGYRKNSAGGLMTPATAIATEDMTVEETVQHLTSLGKSKEDVHCVYLVEKRNEEGLPDASSRLLGVVTLIEMLVQDNSAKLGEFAHYDVVSVSSDEDQAAVAQTMAKYNLLTLPVIDASGHLLGVVTVDDVIGITHKEVSAGAAPQLEAFPKPEESKPKLIGSETAGEEVAGFFRNLGQAISWTLPSPLSWVWIWIAFPIAVYLGNLFMLGRIEAAFETGNEPSQFIQVLGISFEILHVSLAILPFILLAIYSSVVRGIKLHTDSTELTPHPLVRYALALLIATATTLFGYVLVVALFLLNPMNVGVLPPQLLLEEFWEFLGRLLPLIFLPLSVALIITALFAAWRMGAAQAAHKWGIEIRPARVALAAMLVFSLSFAVMSYPAAHIWHVIDAAAMENDDWGEWDDGYWGDGDWGDDNWGDEDLFLGDEDFNWDDFDIEDLFDLEEFEDIVIEGDQ